MNQLKRSIHLAVLASAGLAVSGCSTDPEFWDAVAAGLDQAAYDIAQENAGCYWAPPPGLPYGANQRYCPGDWGYQAPVVVYVDDGHRRGDHHRGGRRDRDRDRDDHRDGRGHGGKKRH